MRGAVRGHGWQHCALPKAEPRAEPEPATVVAQGWLPTAKSSRPLLAVVQGWDCSDIRSPW